MMQFEVAFILLFGLLSTTCSAPREGLPLLSPGGIGGIFEGPDSETIIRGPDGSEITSEQKGGAVIRDDGLEAQPIVVAEPELLPILTEEALISAGPIISSTGAPILASVNEAIGSPSRILASPSTPLLTGERWVEPNVDIILGSEETPLVAPESSVINARPIEIVQQDPHIIETEIIEAPDIEPDQSSDLQGPSGRVITKGSASIVSGPASTTITEPRRIIIVPPKIAIEAPVIAEAVIPLNGVPLAAPLPIPAVATSSIAALPVRLSYSSNSGPVEYGYSTTATPLVDETIREDVRSTRVDLGVNDLRQSIPVVEYSSSNGVINGPAISNDGSLSSIAESIVSSTLEPEYLQKRQAPQNLAPVPQTPGVVSLTASPYVQKIPKIGDRIAVNGKIDMGYPSYREPYQLPQILGMALSRFYQRTPAKDTDTVIIDDKMGDLEQNEILSYDTRQQYLSPPDLSQSKYVAPALARNGIDASQVNLASVPLSQVIRLADGTYHRGYDSGYLTKRSNN